MVILLEETKEVLRENGVSTADVYAVITDEGWCTWAEFEKVADILYDSGYGYPEISSDLKILGPDWWLERAEYDGSEWWNFCRTPEKGNLPHIADPVALTNAILYNWA